MPPEPTPRAPEPKSRLRRPSQWGKSEDKPGWNVSPGADGRGAPPPKSPMRRWRLWPILVAPARRQLLGRVDVPRQGAARAHRLLAAVPARGAGRQRQPGHDHRAEHRGRVQARGHDRQEDVHALRDEPARAPDRRDPAGAAQGASGVEINAKPADSGAACSGRSCSASARAADPRPLRLLHAAREPRAAAGP